MPFALVLIDDKIFPTLAILLLVVEDFSSNIPEILEVERGLLLIDVEKFDDGGVGFVDLLFSSFLLSMCIFSPDSAQNRGANHC